MFAPIVCMRNASQTGVSTRKYSNDLARAYVPITFIKILDGLRSYSNMDMITQAESQCVPKRHSSEYVLDPDYEDTDK